MVKEIVASQKKFFLQNLGTSTQYRKKALLNLQSAIYKYEQEILDALHKDLGKDPTEGYMSEIMQVLQELNHTLKILAHYTKPQTVKTPFTHFMGKSQIYYDPYGVVLIISPWNYPFSLCLSPLIGAIAAGNCVILKPSEYAPHTQAIITKIIQEIFDPSFVCVVCGDGEITQQLLQEKPDYVFFTGSTRIGKIIASACAPNLIPYTLELGGKNPCIIDKSADVALSARRIVWGKFFNAGQTCVAPDFILIHCSIKDKFLKLIQEEINRAFSTTPLETIGTIISPTHFQRALKLLEFPHSLGKVYGGQNKNQKIEPTLIDFGSLSHTQALQLPLMQEEIFAPILPIFTYEEIQQCIQFIRAFEKPLALYLFSQNKPIQDQILSSLSFGGGCINDCIMHITNPHLPFGGVGNSGIGSYHGKYSIETFCHKKSIYKSPKWELPLRYRPYTHFLGISKLKWLYFLTRYLKL